MRSINGSSTTEDVVFQNEGTNRKYRAPIKNTVFEYIKVLQLLSESQCEKEDFLKLFAPSAFVYNDYDQKENREIGIDIYAIDIFNYFKSSSFISKITDQKQAIIKQIYSPYSDVKTIEDQWQLKEGVKYFSVMLNKQISNSLNDAFEIEKYEEVRTDKIELIIKVSEQNQEAKIAKINLIESNYEKQ